MEKLRAFPFCVGLYIDWIKWKKNPIYSNRYHDRNNNNNLNVDDDIFDII